MSEKKAVPASTHEKEYEAEKSIKIVKKNVTTFKDVAGVMQSMFTGQVTATSPAEKKEEFKRKIDNIMEKSRENKSNNHTPEFFQQFSKLVYDLFECMVDIHIRIEKKYDNQEICRCHAIPKVNSSDYGTKDYIYERQSKAKVACKEAIKQVVDNVYCDFEAEKNAIADKCKEFIDNIEKDITKSIDEFQDSFEDYIVLDCAGEVEEYAYNIKNNMIDRDKMLKIYTDLDFMGKCGSLIDQSFGKSIDKAKDVQKYFEICTFNENAEGKYCYILGDAVGKLNKHIDKKYNAACSKFEDGIGDLYYLILDDYFQSIKNRLITVFEDAHKV